MTPFSNIYNLSIITMGDYKIKKLIMTDQNEFYTYMRSLLTIGIPEFTGCLQSLEYISQQETDINGNTITVWYFLNDLDSNEQSILSKTMVLKWWEQKLQEVTVFQTALPNNNYSKMKISEGLKQKSEYKDKLGEDISRAISEYQCDNLSSLPFFGGV